MLPWSPGHLGGVGKGPCHCREVTELTFKSKTPGPAWAQCCWTGATSAALLVPFSCQDLCAPQAFQPVDTLALSHALELKCKKGRAGHSSVLWRAHRGFGRVMHRLLRCCRGTSCCPMLPSPGARPASAREHPQRDLANPKSNSKPRQFNSKASGRAWPRRSRVCGLAPSLPCGLWVLPQAGNRLWQAQQGSSQAALCLCTFVLA